MLGEHADMSLEALSFELDFYLEEWRKSRRRKYFGVSVTKRQKRACL